ncbi:MAG: hypothetical protein Q9160_005287 [Pyrenula sp. 1 TL-2023]
MIGGLGDGLVNLPYTQLLASSLPKTGFRLLPIQLSSSNAGWGIGSIARDVSEIAEAVTFAREHLMPTNPNGKIVLMGSSTGCQDTLAYISSSSDPTLPPVDGAILQAPVSDRDAFAHMAYTSPDLTQETIASNHLIYEQCLALSRADQSQKAAKDADADQSPTNILPLAWTNQLGFFGTPTSTTRWLSLWSPDSPAAPSADDMFSSDLSSSTLATTFGSISRHLNPSPSGKPSLCVLHSGADEFHPPSISQEGLLERWGEAVREGGAELARESAVVEGARHNGAGEMEGEVKGKEGIVRRVVGYLEGLMGEA